MHDKDNNGNNLISLPLDVAQEGMCLPSLQTHEPVDPKHPQLQLAEEESLLCWWVWGLYHWHPYEGDCQLILLAVRQTIPVHK
jgi:hypothetical protein